VIRLNRPQSSRQHANVRGSSRIHLNKKFIVKEFIGEYGGEIEDRSHALYFYESRVMEIFDKIGLALAIGG